ncbi:MAG: 16S rRNA (cytidine(1402)-2'-O)-methyltransferase [Candidatus Eisenbacteria bacterium]|nr:16S rRNA (cytidine(1402)-2'-O)-methyltransferase [Candidatus Eisenbacteria bacterium]
MKRGTLYLVGTPIGNMGDLSRRAEEVLRTVDRIAAEDTRRTGALLERIGSRVPALSFYARNEERRVPELLRLLLEGRSVAVVSDAGNPGIADPAERLVRAALEEGIEVVPVPGPSAFLAALVASGLSTRRFRFEGFLPSREGPRLDRLRVLAAEEGTLVFYESPRRIRRLLEEIAGAMGERRVVLARELTKKFEEFLRGTASELAAGFDERPPRGEFVVLVEGAKGGERLPRERVLDLVREETAAGASLRDAVRAAASTAGWKEQEVYRLLRGGDREEPESPGGGSGDLPGT